MNNGRNGCKKTSSESAEHYSNFLSNDLNKLQEEFRNNCKGINQIHSHIHLEQSLKNQIQL